MVGGSRAAWAGALDPPLWSRAGAGTVGGLGPSWSPALGLATLPGGEVSCGIVENKYQLLCHGAGWRWTPARRRGIGPLPGQGSPPDAVRRVSATQGAETRKAPVGPSVRILEGGGRSARRRPERRVAGADAAAGRARGSGPLADHRRMPPRIGPLAGVFLGFTRRPRCHSRWLPLSSARIEPRLPPLPGAILPLYGRFMVEPFRLCAAAPAPVLRVGSRGLWTVPRRPDGNSSRYSAGKRKDFLAGYR